MANKKINDLPLQTNPTGNMQLETDITGSVENKISLGDAPADTFDTTSKTIMGAVNELHGEVDVIASRYVKKDGDGTSQQVAGGVSSGTLKLKPFNTSTDQISISGGGIDSSIVLEYDLSVSPTGSKDVPDNGYINGADRILSGGWFFPADKQPEYVSIPTLDNDKQLVYKKYVDDLIVGGVNEDQIYYVRSNGSDTGTDGKNIEEAFLTPAKAFTEVTGQTPSVTKQFAIKINDGGTYVGSFGMPSWTKFEAPSAIIKSANGSITDNSSLHVKELYRSSGTGFILVKTGTGISKVKAEVIENTLSPGGFSMNGGTLHVQANRLAVPLITDALLTGAPGAAKKAYITADYIRGKIFTTNIDDEYWITGKEVNINISANAASKIHVQCEKWAGIITQADALCEIDIVCQKRTSSYASDATPAAGAKIRINESAIPCIYAYLSANQSVGINTLTLVTFDTIEGSAYGLTLTPASGTITSLTQGLYGIEAGLAYDLSGTGQSREIIIYVNGSPISKDTERQQNTAQDKQNSNIVSKIPLEKGDTVQVYAWSDANPAINVNGTATYKNQTYFKVTKLGNIA